MKILVFGHSGFIGSQIVPQLYKVFSDVVLADIRVQNIQEVKKTIEYHDPTHVLSIIGRTCGAGIDTIDYLQQPETLQQNVQDNLYAPVMLGIICNSKNIHLTYIGTGCIFNSSDEDEEFGEMSTPNFFGSNYSIVKGMTDQLMQLLNQNVLNIRIRMPITDFHHPRNFITKLLKYDKICSIKNSMTVLPSLIPSLLKIMKDYRTGTINFVNPGSISHNEILEMYQKIVDPTFTWKNFSIEEQNKILASKRSNNKLSTNILSKLCPEVPDIHTAIEQCMIKLKEDSLQLKGHKCVLITGGCGAIGSVMVNYLKNKYTKTFFVNLDALTYAGNKNNIEPPFDNYVLIQGNIIDAEIVTQVLEHYKPSLVIHLAAESHVDTSFNTSLKFTESNVMGTHILLECVRNYGKIEKFIHMSTDEVYGSVDDDDGSFVENALFKPSNPYSASKAAAEMICNAYIMSFKLPICIIRCNNAISKYQHSEKLIPKCIKMIKSNRKIPIHGTGISKRTFIDSEDIARAFEIIAEKGAIGNIYNIGTSQEYTVLDVVSEILNIMRPGDRVEDWIEFVPDREFQDYRYSVDTSKIMGLGWKQEISFKTSLEKCIR